MKKRTSFVLKTVLVLFVSAAAAAAQSRGDGRLGGKIVDEQGQPVADVQITALFAGEQQPVRTKSNNKGDWALNNIAEGQWSIEFRKEGYETLRSTVEVVGRMPNVSVKMVKAAAKEDPNAEIQAEAARARGMVEAKQFAEARKVYEDLLAKYPAVYQLNQFIASTYIAENNNAKAIEYLKIVAEKEPQNVDIQLLLADLMIENGDHADGLAILQAVDTAKVKDPSSIINGAITMINRSKPDEALALLARVQQQFPDRADVYYYRGRAHVAAKRYPEAKADLEKFVSLAPPDSREVADAKKILEQLKDVK